MGRKKQQTEEKSPQSVTDIELLKNNVDNAVLDFAARYISVPRFTELCEVMDQRQLRDAMGLRATFDAGDPWPLAEKQLLSLGFHWQWLGGSRVMFLQEREDYQPDDGWQDGVEV